MPYPISRISDLKFTDTLPRPHLLRLDHLQEEHLKSGKAVQVRIRMLKRTIAVHRLLEHIPTWTYEGSYPGPAIVVRRDQKVQVEWVNELTGTLPVTVVSCGDQPTAANASVPQNEPGLSGGTPNPNAEQLLPWTVVHLHGGRTQADSDGWADNAFLPRNLQASSQISLFTNNQPATMLWYHDHSMDITSYNVIAGLAGIWIVRDEEEDHLHLPAGEFEIPLLIQDRNFDTDDSGQNLVGRWLHKVETDITKIPKPENRTMEFFGPFTLVNGTIWPNCPVEPRAYRLRVLNGSNARTYQLMLIDSDKNSYNHLIHQIGSDGGLFSTPVHLEHLTYPNDAGDGMDNKPKGLILAPAERADLIVDFSQCAAKKLLWVNVAAAPYGGVYAKKPKDLNSTELVPIDPGDAAPDERLLYPEVMQFEVGKESVQPLDSLPTVLSRSFRRWTHDSPELKGHQHRYIALHEYKGTDKEMGFLYFNELELLNGQHQHMMGGVSMPGMGNAPDNMNPELVLKLRPTEDNPEGQTVKLRNRPVSFYDTINIFPTYGKPEIWNIINLSGDTHPIHLHLVRFQVLNRDLLKQRVQGQLQDIQPDQTGLLPCGTHVEYDPQHQGQIDANEEGWKDTIRVNPNEIVSIACIFDGYTGRYMYHCHVLEHEDNEMMRPIVVKPETAFKMQMPMTILFQCAPPQSGNTSGSSQSGSLG